MENSLYKNVPAQQTTMWRIECVWTALTIWRASKTVVFYTTSIWVWRLLKAVPPFSLFYSHGKLMDYKSGQDIGEWYRGWCGL